MQTTDNTTVKAILLDGEELRQWLKACPPSVRPSMTNALRQVGLALHASHNTVATDAVNAKVSPVSWRIDHAAEIAQIELLRELLAPSSDGGL